MPRITLLSAGTTGVDLKTNPLFLGDKKLRFATNLVFEEGVIRTRPGFVHTPLNLSGQFQGACSYRPSEGISSGTFGSTGESLVLAVDGKLWSFSSCEPVALTEDAPFRCKGDVQLFQAENYLIAQNTLTETYWWDGQQLTKSPGLNEQHWDDPEVASTEVDLIRPVASIPDCYPDSSYTLTFLVLSRETDLPIPNASVVLKRWSTSKYRGDTGVEGTVAWVEPMRKELRYFVSATGYTPVNDIPFTVLGVDQRVVVYLAAPPLSCGYEVRPALPDPQFTEGQITFENTSDANVFITSLSVYKQTIANPVLGAWTLVGDVTETEIVLPLEIPTGFSVELLFTAATEGDLSGATVSVMSSCLASDPVPFIAWGFAEYVMAPVPGP
jgi:hypothetical protein